MEINTEEDLYREVLGYKPDAAQPELANRSNIEEQLFAPNSINTTGPAAKATPTNEITDLFTTGATTGEITPTTAPADPLVKLYENTLGRTPTQAEINSWNFGNTIDAGELNSFLGAARNEAVNTMPTTGAAGNLAKQILAQGTTNKWGGQGYGSAEKTAYDMAVMLAGQGITDINDFGKVSAYAPVQEIGKTYNGQQVTTTTNDEGQTVSYIREPTGEYEYNYETGENRPVTKFVPVPAGAKLESVYGMHDGYETVTPVDSSKLKTVGGKLVADTGQTTFGNKKTGEAIESYYDKATENVWGGTFAGEGSTAYGVQFDAKGNPIFYSQYGGSSNDLANLMADLGPVGNIALAVATGGLSIPQQIAAQLAVNVLSGKDIGDAIKSAAIGFAGAQIPGMDFMSDGASFIKDLGLSDAVTKTLTNSFQNAAISAGTALLSGGDIGEAMIRGAATGGVNGAVNSLLGNIEGFGNLTDNQKKMVTNAVTGVVSGKPLDQVLINSAISTAKNAVQEASKSNIGALDGLTSSGRTGDDMGGSYDVVDGLNTDQLKDSGLSNKDILDFIGLSNDDVPELAITDKEEDIPEIVITDDRPINYLPTDDDFPSTPVTYLPTDDDFPSTPVTSPTKPSVKPSTTPSVKPKSPSTAVKKPVLPEYSVQPGSQTIMSSQDPYAKIKLMEELFGTDITYKLLGIDEKAGKSLGAGDLNALLKLLGSK